MYPVNKDMYKVCFKQLVLYTYAFMTLTLCDLWGISFRTWLWVVFKTKHHQLNMCCCCVSKGSNRSHIYNVYLLKVSLRQLKQNSFSSVRSFCIPQWGIRQTKICKGRFQDISSVFCGKIRENPMLYTEHTKTAVTTFHLCTNFTILWSKIKCDAR